MTSSHPKTQAWEPQPLLGTPCCHIHMLHPQSVPPHLMPGSPPCPLVVGWYPTVTLRATATREESFFFLKNRQDWNLWFLLLPWAAEGPGLPAFRVSLLGSIWTVVLILMTWSLLRDGPWNVCSQQASTFSGF